MLEDVQASADSRGVVIDAVGVTGVRRPICVWDRSLAKQQTVASISVATRLSAEVRGAHLSRFMEVLEEHGEELTVATLPGLLDRVRVRLESDEATVDIRFPYFRQRLAPITGARGLIDYDCRFVASMTARDFDFLLEVGVPVTSLCPCSREISDYGAHNQRGRVVMRVTPAREAGGPCMIWIEELADLAEGAASSPLYPTLKREDERFVTMAAYDKPAFVEDIVRDVAAALQADDRVTAFDVEVVNDESIHNHGAFARTSWRRTTG
jgi:GTP cyclohydrolase I